MGPPPPRPVPPAAPSQNGPPPGPRARTVFRAGARYGPLSAPGVPARSRTTRERGGCGQESPRVGPPPPGPGPPAAPPNRSPPAPRSRTAFRAGARYGPLSAPGVPGRMITILDDTGMARRGERRPPPRSPPVSIFFGSGNRGGEATQIIVPLRPAGKGGPAGMIAGRMRNATRRKRRARGARRGAGPNGGNESPPAPWGP